MLFSAALTEVPQPGPLTPRVGFQSWRPGSPRSRLRQAWCLMRAPFLVHRQLGSACSRKARERSQGFSPKGADPLHGAPPSRPHGLPEASPPDTTTLGIRFQHRDFGGHRYVVHAIVQCPSQDADRLSSDLTQIPSVLHTYAFVFKTVFL